MLQYLQSGIVKPGNLGCPEDNLAVPETEWDRMKSGPRVSHFLLSPIRGYFLFSKWSILFVWYPIAVCSTILLGRRLPVTCAANPAWARACIWWWMTARDKVNLDIFWLRDESLEDSANLPDPDVLAQEIVDDLKAALEQFNNVYEGLSGD
jgi:hypothetical protein